MVNYLSDPKAPNDHEISLSKHVGPRRTDPKTLNNLDFQRTAVLLLD